MRSPQSFLAGALLALALLSAPVFAQTVRFVDVDATGIGDGSSWTDAFPDLQQALAVAEVGDEVWVAEGTYRPTDSTDRDASFVLVSGVGLYGGFDGTETERDERDPEQNVTVLSGDLGVPGDISDNAYHVIVASGVDDSTVLDGFTVAGGNGNGANPRNRGGGIYAENSSLVVRGCRIVENRVIQTDGFGGGGGAFFGTSGSPRFERVVFARNGLNAIGGGLWLHKEAEAGIAPEVIRSRSAQALSDGLRSGRVEGEARAAVATVEAGGTLSAMLREVTFVENTGSFGGGLDTDLASIALVEVKFVRNYASDGSGGLRISMTNADLANVGFYGNEVDPQDFVGAAGGMRASSGSNYTLTNVAFVGNVARIGGGLAHGGGGTGVITNVTFSSNVANEGSSLLLASGAALTARNSVFWNNPVDEIDATSGFATLQHVLLSGGCPPDASGEATCEAVIDADPLFERNPDPGPDETWGTADDDYGDLSLQGTSPAVDFGLTSFLPPDTFDLDSDGDTAEPLPLDLVGEARVVGASVDLGAYEWQFPVASEPEPPRRSLSLDVYPNPARGPVAVSLHLDHADQAKVALFDMRGRRVAVLHDAPLAAGRHTLRLETATLSAGVYLVRIEGEAASLSRRLVVLR